MAEKPFHLNWYNPVDITLGPGCLRTLQAQQPLVVLADPFAVPASLRSELQQQLGDYLRHWQDTAPGLASVQQAQALCDAVWPHLAAHPDTLVLAIGGGSTLDLAKVLRYRAPQGTTIELLQCWRESKLQAGMHRHGLWLVPTTAGTGSEVTPWATLWDTMAATPAKLSWAPADGFAERAWVDAELTASCPLQVTRDCGLDTLAHALESLWNVHANALTARFGVEAARLVLQALPLAMQNPQDAQARTAMARASLLAGLAMSQTQTALAHALSYELTLQEQLPHGEACAVWLPMVWEMALGHSAVCDDWLSQVFECASAEGAKRLRQWLQGLNVTPRDLRPSGPGAETLINTMRSSRGRNFIAVR
jgi:alcohol dehydrogenase